MKKTIEEWCKELNITILDPDGFDRRDRKLNERKFSKKEFNKGMLLSTLYFNNKVKEI